MQNNFFELSPFAIVYFTLLMSCGTRDKTVAVVFAVIVHELSHLLALSIFGCRISSVLLSLKGLCIKYTDNEHYCERFISYMAGPLGGLIHFVFGELCGKAVLPEWFILSCRVSIFLSMFNIMPLFPLDGGYAADIILSFLIGNDASSRILRIFGLVFSVSLMLSGLVCLVKDSGFGLSIAGLWLLCANISYDDLYY